MVNEKLLEALRAKFVGLGDDVLGLYANKVKRDGMTDDEAIASVPDLTWANLFRFYSDFRADQASKTARKNAEKDFNAKLQAENKQKADLQPLEQTGLQPQQQNQNNVQTQQQNQNNVQTQQQQKAEESVPTWAKALLEQNKQLAERLNAFETAKAVDGRRSEVANIIKDLNPSMRRAYERTPLDNLSEEQFQQLKSEIASEVKQIQDDGRGKSTIFGKPLGGNQDRQTASQTQGANSKEVEDVLSKLSL